MAAQAGLCLAWSETPEDTFCRAVAHLLATVRQYTSTHSNYSIMLLRAASEICVPLRDQTSLSEYISFIQLVKTDRNVKLCGNMLSHLDDMWYVGTWIT